MGPSAPVSRWIDGSPLAKNGATLGNLLAHRSGLPAWQPFFAVVLHTVPELRRPDCPASTRLIVRSEVRDAAARSPLDVAPGARTLYSDIGFLLAGEMLAEAAGAPLDAVHARDLREARGRHPLPPALDAGTRLTRSVPGTLGRPPTHRRAPAKAAGARSGEPLGVAARASHRAPARSTTTMRG